ncbi:uncharacterized protein [Rutidosis leptorrhynchoides]|uniref:uncharacterized protein n=1 Tax=Rutidosis leptorrhynchoides TaxID=125765 RepID=UPI003A999CD9
MADKKPFRFRLPWLLQPAPTPSPVNTPDPPTQQPRTTETLTNPPRSTVQTFVASTSAQRPPFRPPGKAPTAPASMTSPPTPTVSPKSSPPTPTVSPKSSPPKTNAQTTPQQSSQIRTPPRSPPPSSSPPTSPLRSPTTKTPTEITTEEKYPIKRNNLVAQDDDDLAFNSKQKDIPKPKGVQTKSQKPKQTTANAPLQKETKENISKLINKISSTSSPNQHTNEKHTSVITLDGDNKGASMHLTSDHAMKGDSKVDNNQETKAIVNSNVQGINNSIMFDSSVTERDPGVHLRLSGDLENINDSDEDDEDLTEIQKAEVNMTPPQKLVYNPAFGIDDMVTSGNGHEIEVL